jgi:hypothetical protein
MEYPTRFDLNNALSVWREELRQQPGLPRDSVRELEEHLKESMAELQTRGLNEEESFILARRRVGTPTGLAAEYCKSDPGAVWRYRVLWMVAGWLVMNLWGNSVSPLYLAVRGNLVDGAGNSYRWVPIAVSALATAPLILGLLLAHGRFTGAVERLGVLFNGRFRTFFTISITSIVIIGSSQILGFWIQTHSLFDWSFVLQGIALGVFMGIAQGLAVSWLLPISRRKFAST